MTDTERLFELIRYNVERANRRYKSTCFGVLVEEVGEVACDYNDGRDPKPEIMDVIVAAIRLYIKESNDVS